MKYTAKFLIITFRPDATAAKNIKSLPGRRDYTEQFVMYFNLFPKSYSVFLINQDSFLPAGRTFFIWEKAADDVQDV